MEKNIDNIFLHREEIKADDGSNAIALLEIDVEANGKNSYFIGYTRLQKVRKKWLIIGPYKSMQHYRLDEYINEFISEGISKDKAQKSKHKNKIASAKAIKLPAIQELPPGDETTSVELASVQPVSRPKKKSNTSIRTSPVQANSEPRNKEQEAFLLGNMPIEGNYTVLLSNLRDLFPQFATNIILVDKSQRLLYFYHDTNSLGGFFPVLNVSISSFPQGLYKTSEIKSKPVEKLVVDGKQPDLQVITSGSVTLEKIVLNDENRLLISGYYYLRSFFDNDQKNSLLLSPIDNKTLKGLIGTGSLVYIAR